MIVYGAVAQINASGLQEKFVWAHERSTQECLAIRSELSEPDPLRLAWHAFIKEVIQQVVKQQHKNKMATVA